MKTEVVVYGIHAVKALLHNPHRKIYSIYVNHKDTHKEILSLAHSLNIQINLLSAHTFKEKFTGKAHQGIVAFVAPLSEYHEADLPHLLKKCKRPALILIIDGVTDPHNLGACLRSADATGVDFVIIPKDKNAPVTSVVTKVASGAAETIPIVKVTNLARTLKFLKQEGIWIYGAVGEASSSLYDLSASADMALVVGGEEKGLRQLTRKECDHLFSIPMLGSVSSLNVSVATGVCLYEVVRQRYASNFPRMV